MSGQDEKPFDIPKRLVWQAWKRVAVNGGAPDLRQSVGVTTQLL